MLLKVVILLAMIVGSLGAAPISQRFSPNQVPPQPRVVPVFSATVLFYQPHTPKILKVSPMPMRYSLRTKSMQISSSIDILGNQLVYTGTTIDTEYSSQYNGVCYMNLLGQPFHDLFTWATLPTTQFGGYVTVRNRTCARWTLQTSRGLLRLDAEGNVPVSLEFIMTTGNSTFEFLEFTPQDKLQIVIPAVCYEPNVPCPTDQSSTVLPMVRLHGSAEYEIAETNTADMVGDLFFICSSLYIQKNVTDGSSLVSSLLVETYPAFGKYSFCNYYQCLGGSSNLVGRETTDALLSTGQCSYNTTLGSWYSLPKAARCPPGSRLGPGCSWRLQKRVKTVAMSCLLQNGLFDACLQDMSFPFRRAAAVLQKAFSSALCPDVPPPN